MFPTTPEGKAHLRRAALRIAGIYAIVGGLWILLSDRVLRAIVAHPDEITWLQTGKGWLFVLGTAAVIYLLVFRRLASFESLNLRHRESEAERRAAERELGEKERVLSTLMSNLPGMAYRCRNDANWTMEFVSEGCLGLTGYAPSDLEGNAKLAYADIIHPEDRDAVWDDVQTALRSGVPFQLIYRIQTSAGEEKWVWEQGCGVFAEDGALLALEGFITDITERKRLEERLFQSQKLETLGHLAGGIAHDFNNVLTAISAYSELALKEFPGEGSLREDMQEIRKAAKRGAALTSQLLAFSRRRESTACVVDLNAVVTDVSAMLRRLLGRSVQLELNLAPTLGYVKVEVSQLEQILMNLVVNARDAMPDGGTVTVETANVELDATYVERHAGARVGPHVMLAVNDTGIGMDEKTLARIFEPFFTTKESGRGTGLGLSTVSGIVKEADGNIWVYGTRGVGSTFKVYLPQVDEVGQPLVAAPAPSELPGGSETILVVDDEQALLVIMREVLARSGYDVLSADDAETALELAVQHDGQIDLLVADLVLPGLMGYDLAKHLLAARPEAKVLYISGHSDARFVQQGALLPGALFLQKPFSADTLVREVRRVLDGAAADAPHP